MNTISGKIRLRELAKQYHIIITALEKRHGAGRPLMLFKG
jgi:hypothetical protein